MLMEANNFIVKASQRKSTNLDKAYNKLIIGILQTLDEEKEERWETYNSIVEELLRQGKGKYFEEIKYRLTDNEDPNQVMLDIIDRDEESVDGYLWFLRKKICEYVEEDFIKRFH